jgi:hypothetical protein
MENMIQMFKYSKLISMISLKYKSYSGEVEESGKVYVIDYQYSSLAQNDIYFTIILLLRRELLHFNSLLKIKVIKLITVQHARGNSIKQISRQYLL